jgi:hypothetical protein
MIVTFIDLVKFPKSFLDHRSPFHFFSWAGPDSRTSTAFDILCRRANQVCILFGARIVMARLVLQIVWRVTWRSQTPTRL